MWPVLGAHPSPSPLTEMNQAMRVYATLAKPFLSESRLDVRLVTVFLVINGLVLANACFHDPTIAYDSRSYFSYIEALSEFRPVTPRDSREFFSPPLPFAFPAILLALTDLDVAEAAKCAQFLNVALSIGLTWYLLKTCRLIESRPTLALGALGFLGLLPVYYRSFAYVRGEPYVAFFTVLILYTLSRMVVRRQFTVSSAVILGLWMGLSALSRQWGILVFPAVFLLMGHSWVRLRQWRRAIFGSACLSFAVTGVVSGWFYLHLRQAYGSFTPFNREPAASFALRNQPLNFYIGSGLTLLFTRPVRPSFANELIPIFYSDVWGDYWGYFNVSATDTRTSEHINGRRLTDILSTGRRPAWLQTNYETMGAYLGRVNLVSILPSVLALGSLVVVTIATLRGRNERDPAPPQRAIYGFLLIALGTIVAGFLWFLIMYPSIGKGDTIKATYVLHVFPLVAVFVGAFLDRVERRSPRAYALLLAGLCLVFLHNVSAMLSHY